MCFDTTNTFSLILTVFVPVFLFYNRNVISPTLFDMRLNKNVNLYGDLDKEGEK